MSHIQQSTVAVSVTSAPLEGYPGPAGNTADPTTDCGTDLGVATSTSPTNGVFQRRPGGAEGMMARWWGRGGGFLA